MNCLDDEWGDATCRHCGVPIRRLYLHAWITRAGSVDCPAHRSAHGGLGPHEPVPNGAERRTQRLHRG